MRGFLAFPWMFSGCSVMWPTDHSVYVCVISSVDELVREDGGGINPLVLKKTFLHMLVSSSTRRQCRHMHTRTVQLQLCSRWVSGPPVNHTIPLNRCTEPVASSTFSILPPPPYCCVASHPCRYFSFPLSHLLPCICSTV